MNHDRPSRPPSGGEAVGAADLASRPPLIDGLQYCNWSEDIFREMREAGVDAVHATIAYHENFRETVANIVAWNRRFARFADLIVHGRTADDVRRARAGGRTAIYFGLQNCTPLDGDLGLIEVLHALGVRFMQLSYNHRGPLATGWVDEALDEGLTRRGRAAVAEMNRVGMVVDLSHAGERSALDAIAASTRPVAVSHANPRAWCATARNVSEAVLRALAETGGMLGFSLYPRHLAGGGACTLDDFAAMVARTAEITGPERLGLGSDLCQGQPDSVLRWMRTGSREAPATPDAEARFPDPPAWFRGNRDLPGIARGLRAVGFSEEEVAGIMGRNWYRFFERSFGPSDGGPGGPVARRVEPGAAERRS